jgi:hypothetical protein
MIAVIADISGYTNSLAGSNWTSHTTSSRLISPFASDHGTHVRRRLAHRRSE